MTDQKKKMIYALVLVLAIGISAVFTIKPAETFDFTYTYIILGDNLLIDKVIFIVAGALMVYFLIVALIAHRRDQKYKILELTQGLTPQMILNNDSNLFKNLIVVPGIFSIALYIDYEHVNLDSMFFLPFTGVIAPIIVTIFSIRSIIQYISQVKDWGIPSYRAFLHITTFLAIYGFLSFLICVFLTGYVGIL